MNINLDLNDKIVIAKEQYDYLYERSLNLEKLEKEMDKYRSNVTNFIYENHSYDIKFCVTRPNDADYYKNRLINVFDKFGIFTDLEIDIEIQKLVSRFKQDFAKELKEMSEEE